MMEGERKRAPNFSVNEKTVLLNIIHKFKDIIENKKTNSLTWREKDDAWQKIEDIFNSQTPDTYPRTKEALRKFYDNIKKNVRKDVAEEKKEIFKTGGGVIRCVPNPVKELALGLMNPKTVIGLKNEFDSDNFKNQLSFDSNRACVGVPETESSDTDSELCAIEPSIEHTYAKYKNIGQNEMSESLGESSHDQPASFASPSLLSGNFTKMEDSRSVINKFQPLESGKTKRARSIHIEKPKSECLKSPWLKRRRPAIQQLSSSKLSEEYLSLSKIKMECFQAEKENINSREEREQVIFELQKKKLSLEIETETEKLKKLKRQNNSF